MRKTLTVAWREFTTTVLTKGFIIGVLLPPFMIGVVMTIMPMLLNKAAPRVQGHIAVIDRSGVVAPKIEQSFTPEAIKSRRIAAIDQGMRRVTLAPESVKQKVRDSVAADMAAGVLPEPELTVRVLPQDTNVDTAKAEILNAAGKEKDAQGTDPRLALAVIAADSIAPADGKTFGAFDFFVAPKLDVEVQQDIERQINRAIVDARIEAKGLNVETIRALVKSPDVQAKAVTASGEKATSEVAKMLVPGAFMFLMWISVFTAGQYLLTTTIEEKSSRVMEVLLSAVSPMQLMTGKILGQMGVGALIIFLYAGAGIAGLIAAARAEYIDPMNLVYLAVYFIIAFALIAAIMAAIGSAVSDIREAQSLMGPIMIVLTIPMMLWFPILRNPNSMFAQVCSFIPPISPFVMVLRLAGSEKIPAWQVPASIAVGVIAVVIALWAAAKIFRIGVLMYGKPPNFRTLIRWVRMA